MMTMIKHVQKHLLLLPGTRYGGWGDGDGGWWRVAGGGGGDYVRNIRYGKQRMIKVGLFVWAFFSLL